MLDTVGKDPASEIVEPVVAFESVVMDERPGSGAFRSKNTPPPKCIATTSTRTHKAVIPAPKATKGYFEEEWFDEGRPFGTGSFLFIC